MLEIRTQNTCKNAHHKRFRTRTYKNQAVPAAAQALEIKLQRQLNLPRVEYRARRAVKRIRRAFQVSGRARAPECRGIHRAEIRRAVDGVKKPDVRGVEEIESFGDHLKVLPLPYGNCARDAEIDGTEVAADKRVARLDAHAVVVAEDVSIGVEAGELSEAHGRLNRGDQAEQEIARHWIPVFGRCNCTCHDNSVAHVFSLNFEPGARRPPGLRSHHEATTH